MTLVLASAMEREVEPHPSPLCLRCSTSHNTGESQTPVHTESVTLLLSLMLVACHL